MTKKETEKLENAERELARLKLRLEIIRTICPILAIALQVIILVRVFQRSTWNTRHAENYLPRGVDNNFRRPRASSKSTIIFRCCPETCDQIRAKSHSLFWDGAAAPKQQCDDDVFGKPRRLYSTCAMLVKSFLQIGGKLFIVVQSLLAPIIPQSERVCQVLFKIR